MASAAVFDMTLPLVGAELPFDASLIEAERTNISTENRQEWLAERRKRFGCSDIPAIMGEDKYRSPLEVWADKRGLLACDDEMSEPAELGLELEPYLLHRFAMRTGRVIYANRNLFVSKRFPWLAGTPDGFDVTDPGLPTDVQVKTTGRDGWTDTEVPPYVYTQVQSELLLLGVPIAVVVALTGGFGPLRARQYVLSADEEHQLRIIAECERMRRRVDQNDPPPPDGTASSAGVIRQLYPQHVESFSIELNEEFSSLAADLAELKETKKEVDARIEEISQRIKMAMEENEYAATADGTHAFTFKTQFHRAYTRIVEAGSTRVLRATKPRP